jgi:hypothetical protein
LWNLLESFTDIIFVTGLWRKIVRASLTTEFAARNGKV